MISLYQALKSAAREVSALVSAMDAGLDGVHNRVHCDSLLGTALKILDHYFAPGPLVRADHDGEAGMAGVRQLELLAYRLRAQGVLHSEAGISQLVSQREHVGLVVLRNKGEKDVDARHVCRYQISVFQQLAQHDVTHAEADGGKRNAPDGVQQIIVASATADGPQGAPGVEYLEDYTGVVGQAADDSEIDLDKIAQTHRDQGLMSLTKGIGHLG